MIRILICLLVVASALPLLSAEKPNIILVYIDDMGWEDFSCFGNHDAETPNIDALAAEGVRFEKFYVNSPICSPSRTAVSTGQYPQRWRITSYLNHRKNNEERGMAQWLDPKAPMLARFLHDAGYATGHFGKWHMGGQRDVDDAPPITAYGFDESLTNFEGMGPKLLPMTLRPGDKEPGRIWEDAERLGEGFRWMMRSKITGGFVDAALPFIDKAAEAKKPFYINLWPDDVHGPWWPSVENWGDGERRTLYLAVLEEMDHQLGKLFDRVKSDPELRDNTIILACSDNGPEPEVGSAGKYRGYKTQLYEGGIRSPLVVWAPGLMNDEAKGTVNRESFFSAIDLVPSLLEITGVGVPEEAGLDGIAVPEIVLGASKASRGKPLFFRRPPDRNAFYGDDELPDLAMHDGKWKLVCEYDGLVPELYDLDEDPSETHNIASDHSERVRTMTAAAIAWHQSMPPDNGATYIHKPRKKGKSKTKK